MTEVLTLARDLSGASFAVLVFLILFASWKDLWCWSRDRNTMKAERDAVRATLEEDRNEWKRIALDTTGAFVKAVQRASIGGSGGASS